MRYLDPLAKFVDFVEESYDWLTESNFRMFCFICTLLLMYLTNYFLFRVSKANLTYQSTVPFLNRLVINTKEFQTRYYPNIFLFNAELQTIFSHILRYIKRGNYGFSYKRRIIKLGDGGCISLDFPLIENVEEQLYDFTPILVLFGGYSGGRRDIYLGEFIKLAGRSGMKCILFNHRGCSNTKLTSVQGYHGLSIEDTHTGLIAIKEEFRDNHIYGVGYSIGGTILTNYAGIKKSECLLTGMVICNNPFDMFSCVANLEKSYLGFNNKYLAYTMRNHIKQHIKELRPMEKILGLSIEDACSKIRTIKDYDQMFTKNQFGYGSAREYYRKVSSVLRIDDISIPTLCICSLDDPIANFKLIPHNECFVNENIILATYPVGSHLSYLTNTFSHWLPIPIIGYLKSLEKELKSTYFLEK